MAADLLQVLQQIVKSAREVLGADSSAIWSFDAVRDMFIPEELVADGIPAELVKKFHQEESSLGRVAYRVMERGWVGVGDIANPQYDSLGTSTRELLGAIGVKSFQGITLQVDDKKLGVLYINYNHARTFTGEDRHLLETFANHAALALSKARLLEQVTRIRETARVVAELTALGDLPRTLDSIVQGTQEALQCDAVTLYTYDQDRNKVDFPPAVSGVRDVAELIQPGMVTRDSIVWKMLKLDGPHVAEDASSDPLMRGSFVSQAGIKSSVGIPLTVGDRKVGVMFVNYHSRHRFTADELTNTELLANQAAVAIRNAQLYEETIRRATALEALYEAGRAVTGNSRAWRDSQPCCRTGLATGCASWGEGSL